MDVDKVLNQSITELSALSDPARAEYEKNYQKSHLHFFGVKVPVVRSVAKAIWKSNKELEPEVFWTLVERFWSSGSWETRSMAVEFLEYYPHLIGKNDLSRLKCMVIDASGWAHNDQIGCKVLGSLVRRDPSVLEQLDEWSVDPDLWVRRVAIQSMLESLTKGDLTHWNRFKTYAVPLLPAKDFWTRKVIGWVLRQTSRKNPDVVFEFLKSHRSEVCGLTFREGSKYLSTEQQAALNELLKS